MAKQARVSTIALGTFIAGTLAFATFAAQAGKEQDQVEPPAGEAAPPGTYFDLPKSLEAIPSPNVIVVTPPAPKPSKTVAHKGLADDQVVIKFANGLPIALKKGADGLYGFALRKTLDQLSERDRLRFNRLKLTDKDAIAQIIAINTIPGVATAAEIEPLFTADIKTLDNQRAAAESKSGRELADLTNFFVIRLAKADPSLAAALADTLNKFSLVELAYLPPLKAPNPDLPPATPNYAIGQTMFLPSPNGLNFTFARRFRGGAGRGVTVVDVEGDARDRHEDLQTTVFSLGVRSGVADDLNHGTAVACILNARQDRAGVTGGAYEAQFAFSSPWLTSTSYSVANAVNNATLRLDFGDVILIEQQFFGPNSCCGLPVGCGCARGGRGQVGCVPVEYFLAEFSAIQTAVAAGVTVVEAAGNGNQNLDLPLYGGLFDRTMRDSGAIMVGAADSRSRVPLGFSNFGVRVDSYASGNNVVSCGYGDLTVPGAAGDLLQQYTQTFAGTSSASAIVAAAVTVIQGARSQLPFDPLRLRQMMTLTGARQSDVRTNPNPNLIGTKPDLQRLLTLATQ